MNQVKFRQARQEGATCIKQYTSDFLTMLGGILVGLGRFELPTSPLSGVRSNQLSYRPPVTGLILSCLRCLSRSVGHVLLAPSLHISPNALTHQYHPALQPS